MRWSLYLITGLMCVCSSNVSPALMTSRLVPSWFLLPLTTHVATCWLLTASPSPGVLPRCQGAGDGCQYRQRGTVGIPSRQAGCPDSNNNEEGVHALHKVCALENVSDAICHLLCTSFYTSITIFHHFLSSWNHLPGLSATAFIVQT